MLPRPSADRMVRHPTDPPALSSPGVPLSRRTFLGALPLLPVAMAGLTRTGVAAGRRPKGALGMSGSPGAQLYTVRRAMKADFEGTLAAVAAIGYGEVEFAGYFGRTAAQTRSALAAAGLTSPSTHVPFDDIETQWSRTVEFARGVGHEWVTIPWLPSERRRTIDDYKRVAELLNGAAATARASGLRLAYHNHDFEFAPIGGTVPYEILATETDPALVDLEMDIYWVVRGGADPLALIAKHPGRFTMVHLKDSAGPPAHAMRDVGSGTIDFGAIFARAREAGIRHAFVEHDEPPDEMASLRASYPAARRLAAHLT